MAPDKTHPSEGKDVKIDVVSAAEQEALLLKKGGGDSKQSEKALNVAKANEMSFWLFRWITKVKPRYLVALVPLFGVLVMAGGWVAINSISRTACESQENDALLQFWNAANGIQEEVVTHTYAATTIASYVRQQPNLQEILDYPFQDIATDLLALDSSVINLQIAPGGRVNTIVPLAGSEGAIGHDLFLDPKRRADALRTVENGHLTLAGPFNLVQGGKGLLARNPVFLPAPTGNRTEAWGFPDAHECGDLCYGDDEHIFWGFAVALIDWERLLANTALGDIVLGSNKYELTRNAGSAPVTIVNSDEAPVEAGQRVVNIPIPLPSTTWMLAVQLSNSCESWVPGTVAAWAVGSLLLTLAGFYALYLMAQNSDLQKKELKQLRDMAEQREREKVIAGSEAVARMIAGVIKVSQKEFKRLGRVMSSASQCGNGNTGGNSSMEGHSINPGDTLGLSADVLGFRASILIPDFDNMTAANKSAATVMFTMTKGLCWNLAAESGGHDMEEANGALSARFKHSSAAVAFALKARRTLMWASWPEEVLALPGCSQTSEGFRMAGGPRVSMLIDTGFSSGLAAVTKRYLSCIHPRQILITDSAWAKVTNMQDAGYPYVLPLGKFAAAEGLDTGVEDVVTLLEVNEPVWDYRLPQIRFGQLKNITKVMDCNLNLHRWPRMLGSAGSQLGVDGESPKMVAALLQLDATGSNGSGSQRVFTELDEAVQSVALLFHGYMSPVPLSWAQGAESAVFFPSVDCAFAFCASLQMLMSKKKWGAEAASQFPFPYAGQIMGPLARDGPRLKAVIVSAPEAVVDLFKNIGRNSGADNQSLRAQCPPWLGFELLRVALGGQVIADSRLLMELTLAVPSLMDIIDLGVHQVANGFDSVRICEARLLELGPPNFPKLLTSKELIPGYLSAPLATTDLAFVYCQIAAVGSSATASSRAFMDAIELWKDWCRNNLSAYGGYDCGDRSTAMVLTFPSLEGAVSFCLTMQKEAMDLPVSEELLQAKGYEPETGKNGQMIFRGIKPKAGIAFGTPIMCRPHQKTGLANYFGPCVTKAVKLMVAAAPGQVLADGPAMASCLHLPEEWRQDEWSMELSDTCMEEAGCKQIHLKTLGRYKLEGEAVPVRIMSLCLPELAERTFSALPGKISEDGKMSVGSTYGPGASSTGGFRTQAPSANLSSMISDLLENKKALSSGNNAKVHVLGVLGQGTQGKVLLGRWKGVKVAYKITQIPMGGSDTKTHRAEMHALMELAISAAMGHPNVVQTYNYELVKVDMKEGQEQADEENSTASALLKASTTNAGGMPDSFSEEHDPLEAVGNNTQDAPTMYEARLIQELCAGSLRTYLDKKKLNSQGSAIPNTLMALTVATDIANGLSHVHSLGIIHGDLKALNVLLALSMRKPLHTDTNIPSMEAKISDFGLSKRLDTEATHVSNTFSGTLTHMAPEVILAGKLSKSADVYAYGIMLYEIFTGRRAFEGLSSHQVSQEVTQKNRRPVFDEGVPRQVVTLACTCWGPAQKRPTMDQVLESLLSLQKSLKQEAMMNQAPTPRESHGSVASLQQSSSLQSFPGSDPSQSDADKSGVDFAALQRRGSLTPIQARGVSFSNAVPGRSSEPNRPKVLSSKTSFDESKARRHAISASARQLVLPSESPDEAKGGRFSAGASSPSPKIPIEPNSAWRSMLVDMSDDDDDDDNSESGSDHADDPSLPSVAELV